MKKTCVALLFLLFTLVGCLEIDAQDVTIRFDEEADRIDLHVVYRGLFAEGGNGSDRDPLGKAVKDLALARETGEVAFWCNWPLAFDLTRDYPAPVKAMLAHMDVENGALFTDPQGVLCGQQFVRVRDAKAFVKKLNTVVELWAQAQLLTGTTGHGGKHAWDADTKELVREFLRSGEKMLVVEAGRLEVRLPFSAKDHAWFKDQIEQHFMNNMPREIVRRLGVAERRAGGGDPGDTQVLDAAVQVAGSQLRNELRRSSSSRFFWDNDWSITREMELTRIGLGVFGSKELRIKKSADGLYHAALQTRLRADGVAIEDGLPEQELERRFDAFGTRDAELPPKLAALRGKSPKDSKDPKDAGK